MSTQISKSVRLLVGNSVIKRDRILKLLLANNNTSKILTQSLVTFTRSRPAVLNVQNTSFRLQWALISTNKKPDETSIAADVTTTTATAEETTTTKKKTWISYGFDWESEEADRNYANMAFFCTVTCVLVGMGFLLAYWPDFKFKDWGQREAYIELARREALGLPLVDPDLVPIDKFVLPTEEELGDFDIII